MEFSNFKNIIDNCRPLPLCVCVCDYDEDSSIQWWRAWHLSYKERKFPIFLCVWKWLQGLQCGHSKFTAGQNYALFNGKRVITFSKFAAIIAVPTVWPGFVRLLVVRIPISKTDSAIFYVRDSWHPNKWNQINALTYIIFQHFKYMKVKIAEIDRLIQW